MICVTNSKTMRDSAFELLRIFSQFFIVLYHIIYIWQGKAYSQTAFFQSLSIPLHIGVIIFVLLSGYFTIKPTSRGFVKLMGIFLVYDSVEVVYNLYSAGNAFAIIKQFFFLSGSHYWFVKAYLFLFLISPLLNLWLATATPKKRWYILGVLFFVSCYMATTGGDKSMSTGKNVVNFMMLYVVGNQLRFYKDYWMKIRTFYLVLFYLILNVLLFVSSYYTYGTILHKCIKLVSFPYSSPIILLNSILFFMIVGKQTIKSQFINYVAASSFAIYLIHGCRPFLPRLHEYATSWMQGVASTNEQLLAIYVGYTVMIVIGCVAIDKMLTPVWRLISKFGNYLYSRWGF